MYLDEHVPAEVARRLRPTFKTVQIARAQAFKGRDERDYIATLYSENAVFVTDDVDFINHVLDNRIQHAGIVYMPHQMTPSEKILLADIVGGFIRGACTGASRFAFRNRVIYAAHDGLRTIGPDHDELEFSWDWMSQMLNEPGPS